MLVSSDEEGEEAVVSADKAESVPAKGSGRRAEEKGKSGGAAEGAHPRPARPALLAMKLTESETSDDDVRNRWICSPLVLKRLRFFLTKNQKEFCETTKTWYNSIDYHIWS